MSTPRRAALIAGARTPFAKRATAYARMTALDLGAAAVRGALERAAIAPAEVDRVVFGQVVPAIDVHNVAREIVFEAGMRPETDAYTIARACATGYQTVVDAARAVLDGEVTVAVAGGTDCASDVPIVASRPLAQAMQRASRAKSLRGRLAAFRGLGAGDLVPRAPAIAERTTGKSMGESAADMARDNAISREDQDAFAHRSHTLAAAAWEDGRFLHDVVPVTPPDAGEPVARDNLVRRASRPEIYARLRPLFGADTTITAGNSSALTDGAAALIVMTEDEAARRGLQPIAFVRSWAFTALDPAHNLLLGPAYAIPRALDRAGLTLGDIDLVDLHEAFAAQVLSVERALASDDFARRELGKGRAVGAIDWERTNVMGGSIALGHPFAATGGRQLLQSAHELHRRGGGTALCTACAAGGLGAAMILDVP